MAIALVQSTRNSGVATTSVVLTPGASPTNGSAQVIFVSYLSATPNRVSSITQTNVTWVFAGQANNSNGISTEVWYALNAASAGATATVNLAASLTVEAHYHEYSGVATVSALDQLATSVEDSGGA